MQLKILHLNLQKGRFLQEVVDFVLKEKFDILSLQEVSGGTASTIWKPKPYVAARDVFPELLNKLDYAGKLGVSWRDKADESSYLGNAVLYKKDLQKVGEHILHLKPYKAIDLNNTKFEDYPRCVTEVVFNINGKRLSAISSHLAWGPKPIDKPYKLSEGKILVDFLKQKDYPFILTGDFNLTPDSQVVSWLKDIAIDQTSKLNLTNTLNPKVHYAQEIFPPGVAVDYIFTSPNLEAKNIRLIDVPTLSDHYGLAIEVTI